MVDLETFRRRIGCFNPKQRRLKDERTPSPPCAQTWFSIFKSFKWKPTERDIGSKPVKVLPWKVSVALIFVFNFISWLPNDERHGKNTQREGLEYISDEEKKSFNKVRTLESNLIRSESHHYFFSECQKRGIRPINLEYNGNFNVAFADNDIMAKLKVVDNNVNFYTSDTQEIV